MELNKFLSLIKRRKQTVFSITFTFLVIVLVFTFAQPLKYRSTTKLLVVQSNNSSSDAYSISRSNQFLGNILSEVIYSDSFFELVLESGFNIRKDAFSDNPNKRKKQWERLVSAKSFSDTGIIVVHTYHQDKYQAKQINQAIAYILKMKHNLYHGLGDKVSVRIIDKPSISDWPVKPNIILNAIFGVLFGLLLSFGFICLYSDKEIRIWRGKQFRGPKTKVSDISNQGQAKDTKEQEVNQEKSWHNNDDVFIPADNKMIDFKDNENYFKRNIDNIL